MEAQKPLIDIRAGATCANLSKGEVVSAMTGCRSLTHSFRRHAVVTERCEHDITANLRGTLVPVVSKHRASITKPTKMGELLRDIERYRGSATLRMTAHVFVRPGELRHAEWVELDLDAEICSDVSLRRR